MLLCFIQNVDLRFETLSPNHYRIESNRIESSGKQPRFDSSLHFHRLSQISLLLKLNFTIQIQYWLLLENFTLVQLLCFKIDWKFAMVGTVFACDFRCLNFVNEEHQSLAGGSSEFSAFRHHPLRHH